MTRPVTPHPDVDLISHLPRLRRPPKSTLHVGTALTTMLAAAGAAVVINAPDAAAVEDINAGCVGSGSVTFTCEYSNFSEIGRFTVPQGVTQLTVSLSGASGGAGAGSDGGAGGEGGEIVDHPLPVDGGDQLDVYLGDVGKPGTGCGSGPPDPGGAGGWSGGDSNVAGGGGGDVSEGCAGGGGGGGSFIMNSGESPDVHRPLLAAGGGGGGGGEGDEPGGVGGQGDPGSSPGGGPEGGESGDEGGEGGAGGGDNGRRGNGGDGTSSSGGGGGGYLGGGGGGVASGPDPKGGGGGGCGIPTDCPDPTPEPQPVELPATYRAANIGTGTASIVYQLGAPTGDEPSGSSGPKGGHGGPSSNDPNPNTNPGADPQPMPGMDPATATARCKPEKKICTVSVAGPDSRFKIDAEDGRDPAILFATMYGNWRPASVEASGKPNCPNYTEQNSDWVQFGFFEPERGKTWHKTAYMTQRQKMKRGAAEALAKKVQICFAAPYKFPTRTGYGLAHNGPDWMGVLPQCGSARLTSTKAQHKPCVAARQIVKVKNGWTVKITFRIPATNQDPKALG